MIPDSLLVPFGTSNFTEKLNVPFLLLFLIVIVGGHVTCTPQTPDGHRRTSTDIGVRSGASMDGPVHRAGAPESRPVATVPNAAWAPVAVGVLIGAAGLIGLVAGQPWLFPSLGPTAFLLAESPGSPQSRFYDTTIGHLAGLAAGLAAVFLFGLQDSPGVLASETVTLARIGAAVLAVALTMLAGSLLKASHPPASATTLLMALGGFHASIRDAAAIVAGVLIVAALGEGLKWARRRIPPPPGNPG